MEELVTYADFIDNKDLVLGYSGRGWPPREWIDATQDWCGKDMYQVKFFPGTERCGGNCPNPTRHL